MKGKFVWSNEDMFFILGGLLTLTQISFNVTDPVFALAACSILKGICGFWSLPLGANAAEDVTLICGGFATLCVMHFDYHNPTFAVALGAMIKAGFGIFGQDASALVIQKPQNAPPMWLLLAGVLGFLAISSPGYANPVSTQALQPVTQTGVYLMPETAFQLNPNGKSEALGVGEMLTYATLDPLPGDQWQVNTIFSLSVFGGLQSGSWFTTGTIGIDYGFAFSIPTLKGVPDVGITVDWNSVNRGASTTQLIATEPVGDVVGALIHKVF